MPSVPLKKLVVELRYKPDLSFYGRMDAVALHFAEEYPDWERTALTVEIRNRKVHRRALFAHRRAFYESDLMNADPATEFESATKVLKYACNGFGVEELERIGVRQWFLADLDKTFALMVDEFSSLFLSQSNQLKDILHDKPTDLAYVVDFDTEDGWKYHFRLGPMTKEEWIQRVPLERGIFANPDDKDSETFDRYCEGLPPNFLFIDIDCYAEKVKATQLSPKIMMFRHRSHELASRIIAYCKQGTSK